MLPHLKRGVHRVFRRCIATLLYQIQLDNPQLCPLVGRESLPSVAFQDAGQGALGSVRRRLAITVVLLASLTLASHDLLLASTSTPPQSGGDSPPRSDQESTPAPDSSPSEKSPRQPVTKLHQLDDLPFGETLVYRGFVEKAGLRVQAGRATLKAHFNKAGDPVLEARAFAEKFGYKLNTRIQTTLQQSSFAPSLYEVSERGTERRTKKLVFKDAGADFVRLKHCRVEGCENPEHLVKQPKMHGPIPWGTELAHCPDKKCRHRAHYSWQTRLEHQFEEQYVDLLSAVYMARLVDFDTKAEPVVIPIVNDTRRWKVRVHARREKSIEVHAGTFDAVQLVLEPIVADGGEKKEKFKGLFGLNGAIKVWVEKSTRRPILIEGTLPFAFLDLHAEVELERIEIDQEVQDYAAKIAETRRAAAKTDEATETPASTPRK